MYEDLKDVIVNVFRLIEERGWNFGRAGNISVFMRDRGHLLITPTGVLKARLRPNDILVLDLDGNVIEGVSKPSTELPLHLAIYREYSHINAIIHAHGLYSTVLAVAREPLPPLIEEMILHVGGDVRVADYAPAGSKELAENAVRALKDRKAVILANHGIVACGKDLEEAVEILGLVERLSQIYIYARLLGKIYRLPREAIERWEKIFKSKL